MLSKKYVFSKVLKALPGLTSAMAFIAGKYTCTCVSKYETHTISQVLSIEMLIFKYLYFQVIALLSFFNKIIKSLLHKSNKVIE